MKRWEVRLDYLLARLSHIPLDRLHPLVLHLLRLGAFQLLWLDRVPARAVLHEAGNLAKAKGLPRSHVGFINAVLRRLAAGEAPPLPDPASDPVLALSVIHSHPAWLVRRWLEQYGAAATAARLTADNLIPPLTVRVNTLKTDPVRSYRPVGPGRGGGPALPVFFGGPRLRGGARLPHGLCPRMGRVSGSSRMKGRNWPPALLPLGPNLRLAEIGAGRGGKTTHLAEAMGNSGLLAAVDNHRGRLQELRRTMRRWGVETAHPLRADAARALPLKTWGHGRGGPGRPVFLVRHHPASPGDQKPAPGKRPGRPFRPGSGPCWRRRPPS